MDLYREYKKPYRSIYFILSNSVSDFRMALAGRWLREWGYYVDYTLEVPAWLASYTNMMVVSRPALEMCNLMKSWFDAGKTIVIDMDDDFASIPSDNPAYQYIGAGRPGYIERLHETIHRADILTGTTPEIANRYNRDTVLIPNCWDEKNPIWDRPKFKRNTINIGWIGTKTHRADFEMIREPLLQILSEFPETKIVIGVDDDIYKMFQSFPENRKLFIPPSPYDIYPSFYLYADIILAPLLDTYFNRAKSEIKLIEAGAGNCAWLASPLPFYTNWKDGGLITDPDKWYENIKQMVTDDNLRKECSVAGRAKAMTRTSEIYAREWEKLVNFL